MSLYVIKQKDKVVKMPVRYRGRDPKGIKDYGELKYNIKETLPYDDSNYHCINILYSKMQYHGYVKNDHVENRNKVLSIVTIDNDYNVLKEEPYDVWHKTHRRTVAPKANEEQLSLF